MAATSNDELLTPTEVATLFRVDPKTVARWAEAGKLSTVRTLGGHHRYRANEIRKLLWTPGSEFANQLIHVSGVIRPEQPENELNRRIVASGLADELMLMPTRQKSR